VQHNTGMGDPLDEYRRKRDAVRTPEPVPAKPPKPRRAPRDGGGDVFVIQQHHARSLHWDLRLERDGVLVSWAVPRGIPRDPARNHLAVHTEDHPMEYADFHGEIPAGEYGGGRMMIYDRGTYTTEKWLDDEVIVVLDGERVSGRYVLFHTGGKDWMIHRMDPPEPGWVPMPELIRPMTATAGARLPSGDAAWGYEMAWTGERAVAYVSGGRIRLLSDRDRDLTAGFPELRALAETLAPAECALDGIIVAFDSAGQVSRAALRPRIEAIDASAPRRRPPPVPVQYLVFDLLWRDGRSTVDLPYAQRRDLLGAMELSGPHWQLPPHFTGRGRQALQTSRAQGLAGVVAKKLDSPYSPGQPSRDWRTISA
jgi:bifunctional non-homologous end joining protein LigD